jgi:hypothetical protein
LKNPVLGKWGLGLGLADDDAIGNRSTTIIRGQGQMKKKKNK